jgi:hypothetical protein
MAAMPTDTHQQRPLPGTVKPDIRERLSIDVVQPAGNVAYQLISRDVIDPSHVFGPARTDYRIPSIGNYVSTIGTALDANSEVRQSPRAVVSGDVYGGKTEIGSRGYRISTSGLHESVFTSTVRVESQMVESGAGGGYDVTNGTKTTTVPRYIDEFYKPGRPPEVIKKARSSADRIQAPPFADSRVFSTERTSFQADVYSGDRKPPPGNNLSGAVGPVEMTSSRSEFMASSQPTDNVDHVTLSGHYRVLETKSTAKNGNNSIAHAHHNRTGEVVFGPTGGGNSSAVWTTELFGGAAATEARLETEDVESMQSGERVVGLSPPEVAVIATGSAISILVLLAALVYVMFCRRRRKHSEGVVAVKTANKNGTEKIKALKRMACMYSST